MDDRIVDDPPRRRTVEWDDPRVPAEAAAGMDGPSYLRDLIAGRIPPPPMAALLGIDLVSARPGRSEVRMRSAEYLYNPIGTVHGGAITTMLDSAMGCAVHSTLGAGRACTTLEIKVNFVSGVTIGSGVLRATGEAVHMSGHHAVVEGRLYDDSERLCAMATSTYFIVDVSA